MNVPEWLFGFIAESNRIEGIKGVYDSDVRAHHGLIDLRTIDTPALETFVSLIAPGHRLRDKVGLDVRVGDHVPPRGGPMIRKALDTWILDPLDDPYKTHLAYETLHPFTDGNGRSGRALWLWQMLRTPEAERAKALGFLHTFYYQTLSRSDGR